MDEIARLLAAPLRFVTGFRHALADGYRCPPHSHRAIEIVYHPSGAGTSRVPDAAAIAFAPGDVLVYPADLPHDQHQKRGGEDVCVQMAFDAPPPAALRGAFAVRRLADRCLIGEIEALADGHTERDPLRRLALAHRATAVLCALVDAAETLRAVADGGADEHHAARARAYIEQRFRTIGSVEEVAEALGLSPDYLRHAFRTAYGTSLVRWLTRVRVDRAKEVLAHTSLPHAAVAELCGFADQRYFATVFRKLAGTTPGSFRRRNATSLPRGPDTK